MLGFSVWKKRRLNSSGFCLRKLNFKINWRWIAPSIIDKRTWKIQTILFHSLIFFPWNRQKVFLLVEIFCFILFVQGSFEKNVRNKMDFWPLCLDIYMVLFEIVDSQTAADIKFLQESCNAKIWWTLCNKFIWFTFSRRPSPLSLPHDAPPHISTQFLGGFPHLLTPFQMPHLFF